MDNNYKPDYELYFQSSPTGIIVLDGNGIILDVNAKIVEWLNAKAKDLVGKNVFMIRSLPRESKVKILEKFSQRLEVVCKILLEVSHRWSRWNTMGIILPD